MVHHVVSEHLPQHLQSTDFANYSPLSSKPFRSSTPSFRLSESISSSLHPSNTQQDPPDIETGSFVQTEGPSNGFDRLATSNGAYSPEQTRATHTTRDTNTELSNSVYVSINEWKVQKLQDIQQRVKQFEHFSESSNNNLPDLSETHYVKTQHLCLPLLRASTYLRLNVVKCPNIAIQEFTTKIAKQQSTEKQTERSKDDRELIPFLPFRKNRHPTPYVNSIPEPDYLERDESPKESEAHDNTISGKHENENENKSWSHGSYGRKVYSRDVENAEKGSDSPSTIGLSGWDTGSFSTGLAFRRVSDLVKSIKDASYTFGSSPSSTIYNSLRLYNRSKGGKRIDRVSCANASCTKSNHSNQCLCSLGNQSIGKCLSTQNLRHSQDFKSKDGSRLDFLDTKEKSFDFASADAGARVLASSKGTVGAKNVLDSNVDKYLLTPCIGSETDYTRWIDIELSEEMILERFQTGNFEYYSSSPHKLVILGAGSYPPLQWNLLGMFEFADVKSLQMFNIEKRLVSRYLRVMFSGRQGQEYYCPVSVIRAFGKNLIADWKDTFDQKSPFSISTEGMLRSASQNLSGSRQNSLSNGITVRNPIEQDKNLITLVNGDDLKGPETAHDMDLSIFDEIDSQKTCFAKRFPYDLETPSRVTEAKATINRGKRRHIIQETDPKDETKDDRVTHSSYTYKGDEGQHNDFSKDDIGKLSEDDQVVLGAIHANTFDLVPDDGNIFRKVTRILRTLELNQTLTNQYIDAQLSKFAKVIQALSNKEHETRLQQGAMFNSLNEQFDKLKVQVEELQRQNWQRDMLLATLIAITGFIVGALVMLWTTMNGDRGQMMAARLVGGSVSVSNRIDMLDLSNRLNDRVVDRKDSKWNHEKSLSVEETETTTTIDFLNTDSRSVSTNDLVTFFEEKPGLQKDGEWKGRDE